MLLVVFRLVPAVGAGELVVIEVEVTHAERGLEVPVLGEQPLVAVAHANARAPALAALVLQIKHFQVGEVVGDEGDVQTQEMPLERLAEPVADLRVDTQVFHGAVVRAVVVLPVEGVEARLDVQRPVTGQTELEAGVERGRAPVRQVGLDSDHGAPVVRRRGLGVQLERGA